MEWSQVIFWADEPALILVIMTSLTLLLSTDWRLSLLALTLQYIGVFLLVLLDWTFEMAATKLVAGWISAAILGMAVNALVEHYIKQAEDERVSEKAVESAITGEQRPYSVKDSPTPANPGGRIVALLTAMLVWLTVLTIAPQVWLIFPSINALQVWSSLILVGLGLIQIGFSNRVFRVIVGLLTILSGFEIFYASIEDSALVAGLLAGVNLAMALVGAYLLLAPIMQEES
jgi:hypothetical protein